MSTVGSGITHFSLKHTREFAFADMEVNNALRGVILISDGGGQPTGKPRRLFLPSDSGTTMERSDAKHL